MNSSYIYVQSGRLGQIQEVLTKSRVDVAFLDK